MPRASRRRSRASSATATLDIGSRCNEKKTSRSHADFNILRLNSREYAFGHDNLAPISKTFVDDLGGYGATAVDALDAMVCKFIESLIAC